jgi:hypothetical protein
MMISGSAKATTPFGPLSGRTAIVVEDQGDDSVVIGFQCGHTPVILAVAGANYYNLVRELIAHASQAQRQQLTAALDEAVA